MIARIVVHAAKHVPERLRGAVHWGGCHALLFHFMNQGQQFRAQRGHILVELGYGIRKSLVHGCRKVGSDLFQLAQIVLDGIEIMAQAFNQLQRGQSVPIRERYGCGHPVKQALPWNHRVDGNHDYSHSP